MGKCRSLGLVILLGLWGSFGAATQPAPTSIARVAPSRGREVRIPFPQDDGSLTPYTFELGYPLMTLVYDTLMWRDVNGDPRPWLARTVDTSADGRRVTIGLAPGARWQDGTPLTAADVAFTFRFVGEHPHPRFSPELEPVDDVVAQDDATVVISLSHPSPGFADQPLADLPILPEHLWKNLPVGEVAPSGTPVGSGPYRLVEHSERRYRFEANPDYFRGAPAVSAIEVPIVNDLTSIYSRFEAGTLDMIPFSLPKGVPERLSKAGIKIDRGAAYLGAALEFNVRQTPFNRPGLRRALVQAVDIDALARGVGESVPADKGFIHPDSRWAPIDRVASFDDAAARAEIGQSQLSHIDLVTGDNDPARVAAAQGVARAWRRVGLTVDVKRLSRSELSTAMGEGGNEPTFSVAIVAMSSLASYDPDFLRRLFGSPAVGGSLNRSGYESPAFDDLVIRIGRESDIARRVALVGEALHLLAADAPAAGLLFPAGAYAVRPGRFDGWVFVKGTGILDKRSFVEPKVRAAPVPGESLPAVEGTGDGVPSWMLPAAALAVVAGVVAGGVVLWRRRFNSGS